ncbi:MAG: hypothetical protein NTX49_09725 [Chlamydiae bacterium]|nr:hypothetical protein [Chlamydiota bacterium]
MAAALPGPVQTFPGLNNTCGNDCWANSLLQMMATVPSLQIIAHKVASALARSGRPAAPVFNVLNQLIQDRKSHTSVSTANSHEFRLAIRGSLDQARAISILDQEDAFEVLRYILTAFDDLKETSTLDIQVNRTGHYAPRPDLSITDPQRRKSPTQIDAEFSELSEGNKQTSAAVRELFILIPFGPHADLFRGLQPADLDHNEAFFFNELMFNYFEPYIENGTTTSFKDPGARTLSVYQLQRETIQFTAPPEEFILSLNRFTSRLYYDSKGAPQSMRHKIDVKAPILQRFTIPEEYAGARATYEVDSFVCHSGSLGGGHYISYQKIDGNWYCFNDSRSHPAGADEVKRALQDSYFQHYKKLPAIDPGAFLLQTRAQREAPSPAAAAGVAARTLTAPQPAKAAASTLLHPASASSARPAVASAATALPSRAAPLTPQDQAQAEMMQLLGHKETLAILQEAILLGQSPEVCSDIFERLPEGLKENLISALARTYGMPLAMQDIHKQPEVVDDIIYGKGILGKDFSVLLGVLQKYTQGKTLTFFENIFTPEESALLNPLIRAAGTKDTKIMLEIFNNLDVSLRTKLCQLTYQVAAVEKAEEHALRKFFSIETSHIVTDIIAEATRELDTAIDRLSRKL